MSTAETPFPYDPIHGWGGLTRHRRARIELSSGDPAEAFAGMLRDTGVALLEPDVTPLRVDLLRFDAFLIARIIAPESTDPAVRRRPGLRWERARPASRRRYLFVLSPGGRVEISGDAPWHISADGDAAVVFPAPGAVEIAASRPVDLVLFSFDADEILPIQLSLHTTRLAPGATTMLRLVQAYLYTVLQGSSDSRLESTPALRALTVQMARALTRTVRVAEEQGVLGLATEIIQGEHANPDLTPARIAARLGISRSTLGRVFSRNGSSLAGELRRQRAVTASRMLAAEPELPARVLAARSGFGSVSTLERAMLAVFGAPLATLRASDA